MNCLPLQHNLSPYRDNILQPIESQNLNWLDYEVDLLQSPTMVHYARRNVYIPSELLMNRHELGEDELKTDLTNYHRSPVSKKRDIWAYVDYDLEMPQQTERPLPKQKIYSSIGRILNNPMRNNQRSFGSKSLLEIGVKNGGGAHDFVIKDKV
mmetsp:Transcript_15633/g.13675  ORF Transcript_15633/g.13675 Transcript_15633/m.13675 type:complete len:153 (-) Transcript_15633:36-494(-)